MGYIGPLEATLNTRVLGYLSLIFLLAFTGSASLFAGPSPQLPHPAANSVYKIIIEAIDNPEVRVGSGTGWIGLNKEGQIRVVTNAHVCVDDGLTPDKEMGYLTRLRLVDGRYLKKQIFDPFADICILSIEGDTTNEIALKLTKEPSKMNDVITIIGHPLGGPLTLTSGFKIDDILIPTNFFDSQYIYDIGEAENCIQIPTMDFCIYLRTSDTYKVEIKPGSSGSPILNQSGEIVGMIWGYMPNHGKSLGVRLEQLKRFLM